MEKEVDITRLSKKGQGIALLDNGKKVEVPSGLPGDRLLIEVVKKKRRAPMAFFRKVVAPSPLRVEPRCAHVPDCGGCRWQQLDYKRQLEEKQKIVASLFSFTSILPDPIIPCASPFRYRNKMEFSFSQNKAGEKFLGLMIAGSKGRVVNISECFLADPWVSHLLKAVRQWREESGLAAYFMRADTGSLRTLMMREGKRTGHKMVMLTVSGNPAYALSKKQIEDFKECVQTCLPNEAHLSIFLRIQQQIKGQPTQFYEMQLAGPDHIVEKLVIQGRNLSFKISPTSFFQPNTEQAGILYSTALDMIAGPKKASIFDLYCGTGTLAMALSSQAHEVIGIEINPHAIFDGNANLEANGITNCKLICGDVGEKLAELPSNPDVAVIDPPRSGLSDKALDLLISCKPKEILYISCNPATQAENIKKLIASGYQLLKLQPVDQFPHTLHIENIAFLRLLA